jgi:peroxiredoxin
MDPLIAIGQPAPVFTLPDLSGIVHNLVDLRGRIAILNFWSAECPWVKRADFELLSYLQEWGDSVTLWSLASNANEGRDLLEQVARERSLPLVLHDSQQQVADLYGAITTPHLFLLDGEGILRYQGALDDVNFRQRIPTRAYLRQAVEAVLGDRDPQPAQTSPYGCTIVRFTA